MSTRLKLKAKKTQIETPTTTTRSLRRSTRARKISTSSSSSSSSSTSQESPTNDEYNHIVHVTPPKQRRKNPPKEEEVILSPGSNAASLITKLNIVQEPGIKTKYQKARQILNTGETQNLPGREKEYAELEEFLRHHLESKTSGSLYVSGPPGTGKTACLTKILNHNLEFTKKFKKVYINCTSVTSIGNVYKNICEELGLTAVGKEKDFLNSIEKYLISKHKMILLVLDEIDQLIGKKQSILYSIFEWPAIPNSNIVLIGIANALDLTDRMLPRLNTKCELKPKLLHYAPYTKKQIIDIFTSRLEEAGVTEIFPTVTIQLLAAKVSAISGDIRRALDIGRRVVDIAEQQRKLKERGEKAKPIDLNDLGITPLLDDDEKLEPVQLKQVVSVLNNVYGTSQQLTDDIEETFPLQQKLLICALLLILKHDKNKDVTIGRLHDVYKKVCKKRNILAVDQSEFVGLCELVETRGLIRVQKKKEPRQNKIGLQWDENEVNQALQDKQLIASILGDVTSLVK